MSFEMLRDGQSKMMENMEKMNPMSAMPGYDAMRAQQEAFLKAMTGGMGGMANWKAPDRDEEKAGDDLDQIKSQLADLQAKLDRMEE
jgi:polyhydroxyalkanoate synthesis regulator protein